VVSEQVTQIKAHLIRVRSTWEMAPNRCVKEPPIFGKTTNNFSHWKNLMIHFFKTNEVWDIVENGYIPKIDDNNELTATSKLEKQMNLIAINYIINSVSESISSLINDSCSAHEIWEDLINRFEVNTQIKLSKTKMDEQDLNLALMASVDEGPSAIDVDSIIASKNITDETTIEFLMDLVKSRNIKKGNDEIEASTSSANEVHLNWGLDNIESDDELTDEEEGGEEYNGTINETENNLYTNRLEINESSTFMNEILTRYDDESMLQSLLDESNKTLIEKEGIIRALRTKNDILESQNRNLKASNMINKILDFKVKDLESKLMVLEKLKETNICSSHVGEIGILKVRIQTLETENKVLRFPSEFSNVTNLDSYHVDNLINDRQIDTSGLGYKKGQSSFESNHSQSHKESKVKTCKTSNAKHNQKSPNYAFRYNYNNRKYKDKNNFQNNDRSTFNPKRSNKTYFKGPNGWFYELKNKITLQNQTQRKGLIKEVSQHHNHFDSNKPKNVSSRVAYRSLDIHKNKFQEIKSNYNATFKQGSIAQKPLITFCNYCCKVGHISLECRFRNRDNNPNVVWVPKVTLA